MHDADRFKLLFGPYKGPRFRVGQAVRCIARHKETVMSASTRRPFLIGVGVVVLALAWARLPARTAPIPEGWKLPQKKLEELKKQLPKILQDEALQTWIRGAEVRLCRQVGPEEAKVRVLVPSQDNQGRRHYLPAGRDSAVPGQNPACPIPAWR